MSKISNPPRPPIRENWSFFPDVKMMFCAFDRKKSDDGCNVNHDSNVVLLTYMSRGSLRYTCDYGLYNGLYNGLYYGLYNYGKSIPTGIVNRQHALQLIFLCSATYLSMLRNLHFCAQQLTFFLQQITFLTINLL